MINGWILVAIFLASIITLIVREIRYARPTTPAQDVRRQFMRLVYLAGIVGPYFMSVHQGCESGTLKCRASLAVIEARNQPAP